MVLSAYLHKVKVLKGLELAAKDNLHPSVVNSIRNSFFFAEITVIQRNQFESKQSSLWPYRICT